MLPGRYAELLPGAVEPAADAIRIEAPKGVADGSTSSSPRRKKERTVQPVSEPIANTNGKPQSNGQAKTETVTGKSSRRKTNPQDITALIDQAIKFRTAAHDLMHEAGELAKALKQHRRQSRVVQQTLDQIRTLKGLGV